MVKGTFKSRIVGSPAVLWIAATNPSALRYKLICFVLFSLNKIGKNQRNLYCFFLFQFFLLLLLLILKRKTKKNIQIEYLCEYKDFCYNQCSFLLTAPRFSSTIFALPELRFFTAAFTLHLSASMTGRIKSDCEPHKY